MFAEEKGYLEVFRLYDPRQYEGADGQEGEEHQGEDHLDVGPRPEAQDTQEEELKHLSGRKELDRRQKEELFRKQCKEGVKRQWEEGVSERKESGGSGRKELGGSGRKELGGSGAEQRDKCKAGSWPEISTQD